MAPANFGILHYNHDGAAANMQLLEAHFHLIEGSVSALLFRVHGYLSRLVLQIEKFVGSVPDIRHSLHRTRFEGADEFTASDEDEQVRSPPSWYPKLRKNWEEGRAVFNGPYDLCCRLIHYCMNASCSKGHDPSEIRRRMVASLLAVPFATLPCVLVKSKWLRVDWFLVSVGTSVLQGLWPLAFG